MPAVFTDRCACCRRVRLRCQAPGLVSSRARRVGPPAAAGARRVRPLLLQSRPVPAAGGAQPLRRLLHHGIAGGGVRRRALDQAARLMDRQRHPLRPQGPYSTGCAAAAQKGVQSLCCAQVVGISFGHQMVVQALGGKVESAPNNLPAAPLFFGGERELGLCRQETRTAPLSAKWERS